MKITPTPANLRPIRSRKAAALGAAPAAADGFADEVKKQMGLAMPEGAGPLRPMTPLDMVPGVKGPAKPLQDLTPPPPPLLPLGDDPFNPARPQPSKSEHEQIQETARKLIAQTFYGPMLKQMRESPFKSEMFSGGRGGQAFSSMLDQHLAEHMSKGADSKLVRAITRKLEARSAYRKQQTASPSEPAAPSSSDNPNQNVRIHVAPGLRA